MIIPVILGPTCIGKTSLALEIAKEIGAEILSIDSRQVFKDLDIGTGKYKGSAQISKKEGYWEVEGVKIWGYDFLYPNEELNVLKFCEFAKKVILEAQKKNQKIIATCGTGFYLDFLRGEIKFSEIDELRKKELHQKSLAELKEILFSIEVNTKVDTENKLRIITRILSLESGSKKESFLIPGIEFKVFQLEAGRGELYSNADEFATNILKNNIILEYESCFNKYGLVRSLEGLIYKEIGEFKAGRVLFLDLHDRIKFSLHSYIRRQQTFFKKMKKDYSTQDRKELAEKIKEIF